MLLCLTADYTPQAVAAMRANPTATRREAANQLLEAAGGKVVEMFHTIANGPGALVIFDVTDPEMAAAITGLVTSAGSLQNTRLTRLYTMEEITSIRQKVGKISGAYKVPGQ